MVVRLMVLFYACNVCGKPRPDHLDPIAYRKGDDDVRLIGMRGGTEDDDG